MKNDQLYLRKVSKGGDSFTIIILFTPPRTWAGGQYYYPGAGTASYQDLKPLRTYEENPDCLG